MTREQIYVLFSIGGEAYSSRWDTALSQNAAGLAKNAAAIAQKFGVGMEIDYEQVIFSISFIPLFLFYDMKIVLVAWLPLQHSLMYDIAAFLIFF